MYKVGLSSLAKVDTAPWKVRWATTIAVPRFPGSGPVHDWLPQFFDDYTQVAAGRIVPGGEAALLVAHQVTAAVNEAGKILVSCTTSSADSEAVLLPHAGILLLPYGAEVAAYSTATGALRWHAAAQRYQTDVSGDIVYASTAQHGGRVVAYDAVSGRRLWSRPVKRAAAVQELTVTDGIVYLTETLSSLLDEYALLAVRASDGAPLWQRPLVSLDPPQIAATTSGLLFLLLSTYSLQISAAAATAQLVDGRTGRLVASGRPGGYYADNWQSWPARLSHPVVITGGQTPFGQSPFGQAFILTPARGYPASTASSSQLNLAAVAHNVAYVISDQCASQPVPSSRPQHVTVNGVDIRNGRKLWSVRLPGAVQCGIVPQLLPYDGGFAIVTANDHVLLYR